LALVLPVMWSCYSPTLAELGTTALDRGRKYQDMFFGSDMQLRVIWDNASPSFKDQYANDFQSFAELPRSLLRSLGGTHTMIEDRVIPMQSNSLYQPTIHFPGANVTIVVEWWLDARLQVLRADIRSLDPEMPSPHASRTTQTSLRLPFDGTWIVQWGGLTTRDNYHAISRDQRFAYDFLMVRDGWFHAGDGSRNEDHYCFGQPVKAPAAGVVVASESGIPDNQPGNENTDKPYGNYVVIDHGNGEYSVLGHFRLDTLTVKTGDSIAKGQYLGDCGNSGATDVPHVHYHLQNTPVMGDAEGLPAHFTGYLANGTAVERGLPSRGEFVSQQ
jgi:hypothetical protein